jgi:hypothetical protein
MTFWPSWAVQTVGAYLIPLALDLMLPASWNNGPESIKVELLNDAIGLILGLSVFFLVPAAARSGRWVWTVPVALSLLAVLYEMSLGDFDMPTVFFGIGEAGWGQFFITAPTMACICYSGAMACGYWWRGRTAGTGGRA